MKYSSKYTFRYGFANVLLILGAVKEIRILLVLWTLTTIVALIWGFVPLSILFSYDTTVGFVVGMAVMQILGFSVMCFFMVIVFSFYQVEFFSQLHQGKKGKLVSKSKGSTGI